MPTAPARSDSFAAYRPSRGRSSRLVLRGASILFWGLVTFGLTFVELVAELAGPLLLLVGALWWLGLQALGSLPLDPELQQFLHYVPGQLRAGGYLFTPGGLIRQGLLLLAVVAACRTVNGIIARES
ncbi:hypothetical protein E0493_05970 [Roseomonas sp. M0104]|uniref:Uncharacterized protein n=1 Tax=Teichococcus coralli TaxID=2545983 RepID=A0A845BC11_9PROT|nr:hypothetical protein [Pseudoroseomonas coralli]MXP62897.1 hypothetical protein [Pseudoroseomonas coralli]